MAVNAWVRVSRNETKHEKLLAALCPGQTYDADCRIQRKISHCEDLTYRYNNVAQEEDLHFSAELLVIISPSFRPLIWNKHTDDQPQLVSAQTCRADT